MSAIAQRTPSDLIAPETPTGFTRARSWLPNAFWVIPVLVTGVIVRYQIARPQLWRDEFATWWAATRSTAGLNRLTGHIDAVLAPYYHLMRLWVKIFGDSAFDLRVPSMTAVAATAGLVAVLGAFLGSRRAGVLAGILYAFAPSTSRYGQEARPYALATLAVVAATLLLLLALRKERWLLWVGYAVAIAAAGSMHLLTLLALAGHLVLVADHAIRTRSWRVPLWAGGAMAVAVASILPLLLSGESQVGTQLGTRAAPPDIFAAGDLPNGIMGNAMMGGAVLVLAAIGAFGTTRPAAVFGLLVFVPLVAFVVVSQLAPLYTMRYMIFSAPLACVLAGLTLARLRLPGALAVLLLAGFVTLRDQDTLRQSHEGRGSGLIDYRAAARTIGRNAQPGDAIVYRRDGWQFADIATQYYLRAGTPADVLAATSRDAAGSYWTPETTEPVAALATRDRVWVLLPDMLNPRHHNTLTPTVETALWRDHHLVQRWRVGGITVGLYERKP